MRWNDYYPYPNELYHHGIPKMRWGIRRYQNEDGSLTELGRQHYGYGSARESNRHEEAMAKYQGRLVRDSGKTKISDNRTKVANKALQVKQDAQKQKHDETMAKLNEKAKREAEQNRFKAEMQKQKNARLLEREKQRTQQAKLKGQQEILKLEKKMEELRIKADIEDMRRDYAEAKRDQTFDYRYDRAQQTLDAGRARAGTAAKTIATLAVGGAAALGISRVTRYLTTPRS